MKPETVQKLKQDVPELRELIAFLASEAEKLNTLEGIDDAIPHGIAVEVLSRKRAYQTLTAMLAPLIGDVQRLVGVDPQEYVA